MLQSTKHALKSTIKNVPVKAKLYRQSKNVAIVYNMVAMEQKKVLRKYNQHYNARLQILGSGAPGTSASIYLITDIANYLFNCGEGTQRLSQEYRCKISKVDNIFLTHLSWKNVGGLPGLLLTAQDNGTTKINIHCPEGFDTFIETIKLFTHFPNLKISYPPTSELNTYQNEVMNVTYVPLTKSLEDSECLNLTDKIEKCKNVNGKRTFDKEAQDKEASTEKKIKTIPQVICYICEIHPRRGKLLIDKCIKFGISPGPLYGMLKQGLDVTKDDGTVVFHKDVCLPDSPKSTFIVVECPTEEYLDSFVSHPLFLKYQQSNSNSNLKEKEEEKKDKVLCIFHFTPEKILNGKRYQNWMNKFSAETEHVILNDENTCMGSEAVYKNQYLLNLLHPEIFPLLSQDSFSKDKETNSKKVHRARALSKFEMRPVVKPFNKGEIHNSAQVYINEVSQIPGFLDVLKELKANIDKKTEELNLNSVSDYPKVVMLGTGCSMPNKVRNTSGILIRITEDTSILMDCGEATLGQIIRLYGVTKSEKILASIKAIYISHIHADHHLGLIGLLLKRKKVTNQPLYLLIPKSIIPWLNFYNDYFESIVHQYIIVNNSDLYVKYHKISTITEVNLYDVLSVQRIDTTYVAHCKQAYGIAVVLKDGKKIVYSGDTMFSKNLIELGQDCDLLIHEATMESGLEAAAKKKLHSTTSEAINAGKFMNAKFILLTHFSQRYSKIPAIPENETNVGLAYDNMVLKLPQLPLLPLFYPCIKVMFHEYNTVMD